VHPLNISFFPELEKLVGTGGIQIVDNKIKLTEVGSLLADRIQSEFISPNFRE
jgi:hypothetical protein